jgi:tetratricopeptide (TPR) repeat protein
LAHNNADRGKTSPKQESLPDPGVDAKHHFSLGVAAQKQGRFEVAKIHYQRVLSVCPDLPIVHCNLGVVLQNLGDLAGAVARQNEALRLKPDLAEAHNNLGLAFRQQGRLEDAKTHYRRAFEIKPEFAEAYSNLGVLLREERRLDESAACHLRVLAIRPNSAEALDNLGNTRRDQGMLEESALCHERALVIRPDFVKAHNNLGLTRRKQGRLAEARQCFTRALSLEPESVDVLWNKCLLDLLEGDFVQGWPGYEVRHKREENRPRGFPQPLWRGELLNGAVILLHAEQGMGDSIQFLRYVPLVREAGGIVILDVPSALRRLAETLPGVQRVVTSGDPLPRIAWHCPLMSLPLALGTSAESIPRAVPYLAVPPEAATKACGYPWPVEGMRIGIAWSGNPGSREDQSRSIPLTLFEPLVEVEQARFFSLQLGPAASQTSCAWERIADLHKEIRDFADTAAYIANLDLIITVDTSVAHLAGALGKPTWTLIPFAPDWRWQTQRTDSPWYPTMRLFRQPRPGDWRSAIDEAKSALLAWLLGETNAPARA